MPKQRTSWDNNGWPSQFQPFHYAVDIIVRLCFLRIAYYLSVLRPLGPDGKELPASAGEIVDRGWIPGSGRSPEGGGVKPLQYSCLENPIDREGWKAVLHRNAKSRTRLKQLRT